MAIDRDRILEAAQSLLDKKRYDKAIAEYQKVLAADPKDARTLLKIGEAYLKAEQFETAVSTFDQVAQIHAAQGFGLKAIAAYQQAREVVQRHVPHLTDRFGYLAFRIADLYVQIQRVNDAIQIYEETAARLDAVARHRDAVDIWKRVVELDPKNGDRAYRLGDALLRLGDADAAMPHLGVAAESLAARGQRDEALALLEHVLGVRPEPRLARLAAELYLARGGPKDAASAFMKIQIAYRHAPKDLDTLGLLARALHLLRQPDKALEVHKEAARIARERGAESAFDHHMETLLARAPADPVVRKLAMQWSKAPRWVHDAVAAPPGPRLPQPPPRAPIAPPVPAEQAAPIAPPVPAGYAAPVPAGYAAPIAPPVPAEYAAPHPTPIAPPMPPQPSPHAAPITHAVIPGPRPAPPRSPIAPLIPRMAPPPPHAHRTPAERPSAPTPAPRIVPPPPHAPSMGPPTPAPRMMLAPVPSTPQVRPPVTPPPPRAPAPEIPALDLPDFGPEPPIEEAPAVPGPVDHDPASGARAAPPSSFSGRGRFDEEALEEVDFFVAQGMYEDALGVIDEQLARLPDHPLLLDRRREVEEMASAAASGAPVDPWGTVG